MINTDLQSIKKQVQLWIQQGQDFPTTRLEEVAELSKTQAGLEFLVDFVDGVIRTEDYRVSAELLHELTQNLPPEVQHNLPAPLFRALKAAGRTARLAPESTMKSVRYVLRQLLGDLLVVAEDPELAKVLAQAHQDGQKPNVHLLGEAVLGSQEAQRRLEGIKELILRSDVDYVSLKVSSILGPYNPWGFETAVHQVVATLLPVFSLAAAQTPPTFINLDMEEYRDLDLTIEVFTRLMSAPELADFSAGVVLQAYLPDAWAARLQLQQWAEKRDAAGGVPIKVRLVKGANLPMEKVQAEVKNWPQAPYLSKAETDANYLRLLDYSLSPERLEKVHLGIAGHNLFHLALAHQWIQQRQVPEEQVEFEALLGMGQRYLKAASATVGPLRYYIPVVASKNYDAAIAYLVRRLEESSQPENFLMTLNHVEHDPDALETEFQRFVAGFEMFQAQLEVTPLPRRTQNRNRPPEQEPALEEEFQNESDTDPSLEANRLWAQTVKEKIQALKKQDSLTSLQRYSISSIGELNLVLSTATDAAPQWQQLSPAYRAEKINKVAAELSKERGTLAAMMAAETGKTLDQSDPEISEAIDFARYYARQAQALGQRSTAIPVPRNLTVVTPPWNFPLAIPTGSTLAALAAGSTVLLKPAPEAVHTGHLLAQACWRAGIPEDVLQLVVLDEEQYGEALLSDARVDQVILTGSIHSAELFQDFNQNLRIFAETSGKNAMIITDSADYDEAVKDLIQSAFGHAGQKCSAASLAILVGSAATSASLHQKIVDATSSLVVGLPENLDSQLGPVIESPTDKLLAGLTTLEPGQHWVVQPEKIDTAQNLFSAGVRAGVKPGSAFHLTEYFGPILGIMQAPDLVTAVEWANQVEFGLTAGLHSLKPAEIRYFQRNIQAGNIYINRTTTGAIVQRQPFGGWKRSLVGSGAKAGGPNYLLALTGWREDYAATHLSGTDFSDPQWDHLYEVLVQHEAAPWLLFCLKQDLEAQQEYFAPQEMAGLRSEANILRYFSVPVTIRYNPSEPNHERQLLRTITSALLAQLRPQRPGSTAPMISVSTPQQDQFLATTLKQLSIGLHYEKTEHFQQRVDGYAETQHRVRSVGQPEHLLYPTGCAHYDTTAVSDAIIEAQPYLVEQTVSMNTHRYGSPRLGLRKLLD